MKAKSTYIEYFYRYEHLVLFFRHVCGHAGMGHQGANKEAGAEK